MKKAFPYKEKAFFITVQLQRETYLMLSVRRFFSHQT
jgi:hypothetical protein